MTVGRLARTAVVLSLVGIPCAAVPCQVSPWEPVRSRNGRFELRFDSRSHAWEVHALEARKRAYRFPARWVEGGAPDALENRVLVSDDGRHVVVVSTALPLHATSDVVLRFFTEGVAKSTYSLGDLVSPGCSVKATSCGDLWILGGPVIEGETVVISTLQLLRHRFRLEDGAHLEYEVPAPLRDVAVVSGLVKQPEPGWRTLDVTGVLRGNAALVGTVVRFAFDETPTGYPEVLAEPDGRSAGTVVLRDGRLDPLTREFHWGFSMPLCDPMAPLH